MWKNCIKRKWNDKKQICKGRRGVMCIVVLLIGIIVPMIMCACLGHSDEELFGLSSITGTADETKEAESGAFSETELSLIYVFVCGAVRQPGVVALPEGSRAEAGVLAAGGMREDADPDYVNLAELLKDGQKLYIPTLEEGLTLRQAESADTGLVNINTADSNALCTLPGIGESRARDIIAYRETNGAFASIEDIMKVSGIKESAFSKIKDLITV